MISLREYILRELREDFRGTDSRRLVCEGIDFDPDEQSVWFRDEHEDNVDTSLYNNPTVEIINGVEVWSIFKRKTGEKYDGNPLLYAITRKGKWHFKDAKDDNKVDKRIEAICKKFLSEHKYQVTAVIPSSGYLNHRIAGILKSLDRTIVIVDDMFRKLTVKEVKVQIESPNSLFRQTYKKNYQSKLKEFHRVCSKMNNGIFKISLFENDQEMYETIEEILKTSEKALKYYSTCIDGKDVLIIDEIVSHGKTIKNAIKYIKQDFKPKSVSVLTLFSKLDKKNEK